MKERFSPNATYVSPPPFIEVMVTGWLKRGLLEINLKLEALEDGAWSDHTPEKPNTRKTLRGIVRDEQSIILP